MLSVKRTCEWTFDEVLEELREACVACWNSSYRLSSSCWSAASRAVVEVPGPEV